MNRIRRTFGVLPVVALVLAACAAPGTGGGDLQSSSPTASAPDGSSAPERVDIGDVYADPAAYAGQEIRILGRVDTVLVDEAAFLTSPSGEEDGLLVVVADDATVDKVPAERSVLWITGTVVPRTAEDLSAAGALVPADDAALAEVPGDVAIVATQLGDPLD